MPRARNEMQGFFQGFHCPVRFFCHGNNYGHVRFDLGGLFSDAGTFAVLCGLAQQSDLPEHSRSAPLSRYHNTSVHFHRAFIHEQAGILVLRNNRVSQKFGKERCRRKKLLVAAPEFRMCGVFCSFVATKADAFDTFL